MTTARMKELMVGVLEKYDGILTGYEDKNEGTLQLTFAADNLESIDVFVCLSVMDDGAMIASLSCYDLVSFENNYAAGLTVCNKANDDDMVKYYIDEDKDTVVHAIELFNAYGVACDFDPAKVLLRAIMIALAVDEAYPVFAKAKWA